MILKCIFMKRFKIPSTFVLYFQSHVTPWVAPRASHTVAICVSERTDKQHDHHPITSPETLCTADL